jgi:topoisomerase IV subunit A
MNAMPDSEPAVIQPVPFTDALSERYLAYALSTITARSLPDVRDGLKPVQRRLLYAMLKLRLDPVSGYKKCARVVGDVIGKFHPHGETAIYDAMVRLAQSFAQRYPLVDGQGNFGNIDGDNAAAMRYTEARLTDVAMALLEAIDEDTVDFRPTYDGEEEEPVVLPAAFPNLLANGTSGIAVGMATSIPPHNAGELCRALSLLLDRPDAPLEALLEHVQGPDLPTGGILVEPRGSLTEAYRHGRGSLRLRARWQREDLPHGQYQVVVSEIPYQVQKARIVERIAELLVAKKLALLGDVRDESTEEIRLVLVPRSRTVAPEVLMEQLFRQTELEVRLSLNLNVLDANGVPRVMGLRQVLNAFLDHRMTVLIRRSRHRLGRIEDRLEVISAFHITYLNLDEVIRIIREEDDPKIELMRAFDLNDRQAEAILNMRLRNLRRLEERALLREQKALKGELKELKDLLADEGRRRANLKDELIATGTRFGAGSLGLRRTSIEAAPEVSLDALEIPVERTPVTVVCSRQGWIRVLRGHLEDQSELKYKEGDGPRFVIRAQSADRLLMLSSDGRSYLLSIDRLPGARGQGEPLRLHADLSRGAEPVMLDVHRPERHVLLVSSGARGFLVEEKAIGAQIRAGRQVFNLSQGETLRLAMPVEGDHLAVIGTNRKLLLFPLAELPVMARGKGVLLQRYREGRLSDATVLLMDKGLSWQTGRGTRSLADLRPWLGRRGQAGRIAPGGFPRANRFDDRT